VAGADQRAGSADDVSQVQVLQHRPGRLRHVGKPDEELQLLLAVVNVGEDELSLAADRAHPAGHAQLEARGFQLLGRLLPVTAA